MTETINFSIRHYLVPFFALTIAVTSGFGVQYLLVSNGDSVLYSRFVALVFGSGLAIVYNLAESQLIEMREKLEGDFHGE